MAWYRLAAQAWSFRSDTQREVLIRQIAGLIARRIITDHQPGTEVKQAERLGMIRFGSRVDLFLPLDAKLTVKQGERTVAGTTVVARWT